MFLTLWNQYINDPFVAQNMREYSLFGVNHYGTNCIFRPSTSMVPDTGMMPTNSDGVWYALGNGSQGITPADVEQYNPGPLPNCANPNGTPGLKGYVSWSATEVTSQGLFKHPPYVAMNTSEALRTIGSPGGGEPVNKWVDVSVEITSQTNISLFVNRSQWLGGSAGGAALTNGAGYGYSYTNGTIMLGYDDPDRLASDMSSYVLYSNVRVVELTPYIALQPGATNGLVNSLIVTQGASLMFTAAVNYASVPLTSVWFKASAATLEALRAKPSR